MNWLVYLLVAALPVALYVGLSILPHVYRHVCAGCGKRSLRWCSAVKGIGFVDGRSAKTTRDYYLCEECGVAFKRFNKGKFETISREEQDQHISHAPSKAKKAKPKKRR